MVRNELIGPPRRQGENRKQAHQHGCKPALHAGRPPTETYADDTHGGHHDQKADRQRNAESEVGKLHGDDPYGKG